MLIFGDFPPILVCAHDQHISAGVASEIAAMETICAASGNVRELRLDFCDERDCAAEKWIKLVAFSRSDLGCATNEKFMDR
jgi:hypothetical protein